MASEGINVIYGDMSIRKQKRRKRQKLLASEQLEDFAKNTTLHGLRYVTDRRLSVVEKIFWLLTFLLSAALCSYLIHNVWTKWRTSPVLVTINEQLVPVKMVPFPSVTICPQMKTKSSVYNYTAEMKLYESTLTNFLSSGIIGSAANTEKFEDITLLCKDNDHYLNPFRDYCNSSVITHIIEVSPRLEDVFLECKWRNTNLRCEDLFHYVLTQEGVCFIMNTLPPDEHLNINNLHGDYEYLSSSINRSEGWSISRGYENRVKDPYPRRGRLNAGEPDLKVILYEESGERDYNCNAMNTGYKVYMHHPADYPQSSLYYYGITPGQVSSAAVSVSILSTANNLQHYPPEVRQCYFQTERYLRYFRIYSASNCRLECITNYTLEHCGCIGFHMPYDNSSRICTQGKIHCVTEAQGETALGGVTVSRKDHIDPRSINVQQNSNSYKQFSCGVNIFVEITGCIEIVYGRELETKSGWQVVKTSWAILTYRDNFISEILAEENHDTGLNSTACNCLPACESIDYDAEIFKTEFKMKDYFERYWEMSLNVTMSQLEVYFKKPQFVSMRRSELFGTTDFLANCGGLLGLFLGFSFLSLVEILYFATLRLWCTLKRDSEEQKQAHKQND